MNKEKSNLSDNENKKPYNVPRLEVYGDVGAITRSVGANGTGDNGSQSKQQQTKT